MYGNDEAAGVLVACAKREVPGDRYFLVGNYVNSSGDGRVSISAADTLDNVWVSMSPAQAREAAAMLLEAADEAEPVYTLTAKGREVLAA